MRPCLQDGVSEDALLTVYSAMRIAEYDAPAYHVDALDFGSDQHSWLMYRWASCCAAASVCSCTRTKHGSPCTSLCWQRSPGNSRWSDVRRGCPAGLSVRWARRHGNVAAQVRPMRITS